MNQRYTFLCLILLFVSPLLLRAQTPGGVRIGTAGTPNDKAILDLDATGKGLLIPRMDSATRAGISAPPDGLMVFQTNGRKGFWYAVGGSWVFIPDKARSGDNLGNHKATQTLDLNSQRLLGTATTPLGDSLAQVEVTANIGSPSAAFITRSKFGSLYTRAMLSGYGRGPYGETIDYGVWGNAYRVGGWGGIFSAGKPGSPQRWVGLAPNTGTSTGAAIRIVDGNQAAGKVLTSDANGNGTWQALPSQSLDLETVYKDYTIPAGYLGFFAVGCPSGKRLLSGGGGLLDPTVSTYSNVTILYSGTESASSPNTWVIKVANTNSTERTIRVFCNCARVP
ncbi:hypothetical protein [Hymenobacter sp. GOD-10R]|uniref:hypothetical protein n=1 Tax=Hymenobacter sp. GOD-10R TaxID=3093922 RepID=UPI002D77E380|nr:hypothetical protein [Hymenobacter sp. GOD-10R]WRQ27045.1 hypothetical protein SD425_18390 [Hymenobacter sp. GOD-10R]